VTAVSCASSLSKKQSKKRNKINIKSEKLNKRKEKLLVSKAFYNSTPLLRFHFQRSFFFVLPDGPTLLIPLIPF